MRFTTPGSNQAEETIEFTVNVGDGDFNIQANGVEIAYISAYSGCLRLHHIDEDERPALSGLSLSNGKLTVE